MDTKFAVLEYAGNHCDFISSKLAAKYKKLREWHTRKYLPYRASEISILGTEGLRVVLPLTEADAESSVRLKDDVYEGVLHILRQSGVRALKSVKGSEYNYDYIIPAASGFYILPFILPAFLRKTAKALKKDLGEIELLIIDGIKDLTIDILLIIASEINRITVFTSEAEFFQNVADALYGDSGLNLNVTSSVNDYGIKNADIILNTSDRPDSFANRYKSGSVFLDMAGNSKKVIDLSARRSDVVVADGVEIKKDGSYIDNILLEAILLSTSKSFENYTFGRHNDSDFYDVLDYMEGLDFVITTLLQGGKSISFV